MHRMICRSATYRQASHHPRAKEMAAIDPGNALLWRAGFTVVPKVGWGVMIPQPVSELEERASGVRFVVMIIALLGIAAAAVMSWLLARYLAQPMQAVARAAGEVAAGRLGARVSPFRSFVPVEATKLVDSFNSMANEIGLNTKRLGYKILEAKSADFQRWAIVRSHQLFRFGLDRFQQVICNPQYQGKLARQYARCLLS